MDPDMRSYLGKPGRPMTGFTPVDNATKGLLHSISRYAGVALQNATFIKAVFDYMTVPGKAWTATELHEAAPLELATLL
ncbi:hypothetical protein MNEG_13425 [Monoraphidium neglectum]|uniref:Uncharacterized protein n=1 Tax=Monoraphidium neglectum TaxID=145388 RepID=A0A0D2LYM7_9CHLO|nr:hypothetical protein MNEG_13425 [Monoraphidium neglectum]KIY94536.1 hypothetical protein MNEG_13425 [Monoraphidium neglectum]|eukprot:XP_013893556.1 hypothetical protein MNEG_13425 [Monoraphidium neglectum]